MHTHTTASDGALAPAELVALAAERGLCILGITDHDTTEGVAEAVTEGQARGVHVVAGVELNCDVADRHADILGYLLNDQAPAFEKLLASIRDAREARAARMVEKLRDLGATITDAQVAEIAGRGSVGRPHVAQALVAEGFVPDVSTAFELYIGPHGPAYAERYRLTPTEGIAAVRGAGGVPVLAHPVPPSFTGTDDGDLRRFLEPLVDAGLGGLECYYPGYTATVTRWLLALAKHFGLVPTGGSDYHGPWRPDRELGAVGVPPDTLARLLVERVSGAAAP